MNEPTGLNLTPRSRQILGAAAQIASSHGMRTDQGVPIVGVEHIFLAILQDENSVPTQAIREHADMAQMVDDVLSVMVSESYVSSMKRTKDH